MHLTALTLLIQERCSKAAVKLIPKQNSAPDPAQIISPSDLVVVRTLGARSLTHSRVGSPARTLNVVFRLWGMGPSSYGANHQLQLASRGQSASQEGDPSNGRGPYFSNVNLIRTAYTRKRTLLNVDVVKLDEPARDQH